MEMALAITIHSKIQELSSSSNRQSPRILFVSLIRDLAKRLDRPAYRVLAQQLRPIAEEFEENFLESDDLEAAETVRTALDDVRRGKKAAVGKVLVAWLWRNFPKKGDDLLREIGYELADGRLVEIKSTDSEHEETSSAPLPAALHQVQIDYWATVGTSEILDTQLEWLDLGRSKPNRWSSFAYEKKPGTYQPDEIQPNFTFSRGKFSNLSPIYVNNGRGSTTTLIDEKGNHVALLEDYAHGYRWGCFFVDGECTLATLFNDFHNSKKNDRHGGTILLSRPKPPKHFSNKGQVWSTSSSFRVSKYADSAIAFRSDNKDRRIIYIDKTTILVVDGITQYEILRIEVDDKSESFIHACFHKNQNYIAVSGYKNAKYDSYDEKWKMEHVISIYDIALGELVNCFPVSERVANNGFQWSAFVPNKRILLYLDGEELVLYDFEENKEFDRLSLAGFTPKFVAETQFSPMEYSPSTDFLRVQSGQDQHVFQMKFIDNFNNELKSRKNLFDKDLEFIINEMVSKSFNNSIEALNYISGNNSKEMDGKTGIALIYLGFFGSYYFSNRALIFMNKMISDQKNTKLGAYKFDYIIAMLSIYILCTYGDFDHINKLHEYFEEAEVLFESDDTTIVLMRHMIEVIHKTANLEPASLDHNRRI